MDNTYAYIYIYYIYIIYIYMYVCMFKWSYVTHQNLKKQDVVQ